MFQSLDRALTLVGVDQEGPEDDRLFILTTTARFFFLPGGKGRPVQPGLAVPYAQVCCSVISLLCANCWVISDSTGPSVAYPFPPVTMALFFLCLCRQQVPSFPGDTLDAF